MCLIRSVSPSTTLTTRPRIVLLLLNDDNGISFAVSYDRNGSGIIAGVGWEVDDIDEESHVDDEEVGGKICA